MAILTELGQADAVQMAARYGIELKSLAPMVAGSVNSNFLAEATNGHKYFVRIYEEQDAAGARHEMVLLSELVAAGLPTTLPLQRVDTDAEGSWLSRHAGKPVAFYPWVVGESLCSGLVTARHTRALGSALAKLHQTSPTLSHIAEGRFGVAQLEARLDYIAAESEAFRDDVALIRDKLKAYVGSRRDDLPHGIVHGDLFRDNVLWRPSGETKAEAGGADSEPVIAALIDFESAARGAFIFDVMVCLEAWCYRSEFELPLATAFVEGYQSVRELLPAEREAHVAEGSLAALRFATTRITDFSLRAAPGEAPARDYRRFLARLDALERGALRPAFER